MRNIKESIPKYAKIACLAKYFQIDDNVRVQQANLKTRRNKVVRPLAEIAAKAVSKYSKHELNIILAEYLWDDRYTEWLSPVKDVTVNNAKYEWFYKPEYSSRGQMEVKCIDSTHLLTRIRRKSCKGRLDGLSNQAWLKVAKAKKTLLTPIMVEEIIDPMSVSMAKTHFSESVESEMRLNGDDASADLCRDVRQWWNSEDTSSITAASRINLRQPLRRRLLDKINFSRFPPQTMYIGGWPVQSWEGILANIDAKTYLYTLCQDGTYNVRAFSSMIGETFFSELTLNDKRGQGAVTCKEFGQFIGNTVEQLHIRLDPDRKFSYCTSKRAVYDVVDETSDQCPSDETTCRICMNGSDTLPGNINTRDHPFDSVTRKRLTGRRKGGTVSTERNSIQKGTLGVRWEKARCDLSKKLQTQRMGIYTD